MSCKIPFRSFAIRGLSRLGKGSDPGPDNRQHRRTGLELHGVAVFQCEAGDMAIRRRLIRRRCRHLVPGNQASGFFAFSPVQKCFEFRFRKTGLQNRPQWAGAQFG